MEQWTKAELSQILDEKDTERLERLHESIQTSSWRTKYHIQTVTGLMNDPNGFSYYNGEWHLFYQWFPFGAVHGMKHWYHVSSKDLLHWKNIGLGMKPDFEYDNKGCYSGSAMVKGDYLYLLYTGNHRDEDGTRVPYQLIAAMEPSGEITKLTSPIIEPQKGYTEHQRDPKIFKVGETYYILLGAQNENGEGKLLLFHSDQLAVGWKFDGEVTVEGFDHFGYMVECPDIEKIGDQWVLLFSPQGLPHEEGRFENAYANVYFVGDFDPKKRIFTPKGEMKELDRGFDFYAAQCAYKTDKPNEAILEGWFGCSDYSYPASDEEGWANLLTLPRRLTIENGKLKQRPAFDVESLKKEHVFHAVDGSVIHASIQGHTPNAGIVELKNPKDNSIEIDLFSSDGTRGFSITYNRNTKVFMIDRSALENQMNTQFGTTRAAVLEDGLKDLQIFIDHSAVEIFINDGDVVMSSRVFPTEAEHKIRLSGKDINLDIWTADTTVEDDFVLFPEVETTEEDA